MNHAKRRPRQPFRAAARMRGVTLMELMITVVIVGLLAAIAYPSYTSQVQKTRRSDGQGALLRTAQQLERCYTRYLVYNHADCQVATDLGAGILSPEGWYVIDDTALTATSFSLTAVPQNAQANDTRCGTLTLDHRGARGATGTAPDECW